MVIKHTRNYMTEEKKYAERIKESIPPESFKRWIDEWQQSDWEKLQATFPSDGHEPDCSNWSVPVKRFDNGRVRLFTSGKYFDNGGWDDALKIKLEHDGEKMEFALVDILAMARYGWMKLKKEYPYNPPKAKKRRSQ